MKNFLFIAIVAATLFQGCTGSKKTKAVEANEIEQTEGWTEELGERSLNGTPYLTKGAQIVVDGIILTDRETLRKNNLEGIGSEELANYSVEATGMVKRYHCGPMEQCLSPGYIDHMPAIQKIVVTKTK